MEIWFAIIYEVVQTKPLVTRDLPPIEVFLSEDECWKYVRGGRVFRDPKALETMESYKFYSATCRPQGDNEAVS